METETAERNLGSGRMQNLTFPDILYLAGLTAGVLVRAAGVAAAGRRNRSGAGADTADRILTVFAGIALIPLPILAVLTPALDAADYPLPHWLALPGAAVFLIAIVLLHLSHRDLGPNWSTNPETVPDASPVTTGVYRYVRHPMYAAHLLWGVAQALLLNNLIAGPALLIAMTAFCIRRIPLEERLLEQTFGDRYTRYAATTGRLFPRRPHPPL